MTLRNHAVVLGASMSGLLAARILSDHFVHVTVLDRDRLPEAGHSRKAVPQGSHAHALLCSGCEALEAAFPGILEELVARGAIDIDLGREARFYNEGQPLAAAEGDLRSLLMSRALIEGQVRERVGRLPNVMIRDGIEVLDLAARRGAVCGVRVKTRELGEQVRTLPAELVVDATGRGSRLGGWLQSLGFEPAPEERVRIDLSYASCTYRRRPQHADGFKALVAAVAPPNRRSGVALAQEGDRWIVTLVGYLGQEAEPTHAGMREFARGLPTPAIYELLRDAAPLSEPACMRFPFSQRRRYEQLTQFPEGLLAIGDTLCSFNPAFGQGMSVAALQARVLDDCLRRGPDALWQRMFRGCAKVIDTPWTIAVGGDLAFPEVQGERTMVGAALGRYVSALRRGGVRDRELALAFLRVAQLLDAPAALLAPRLVLRTWRASMASRPQAALDVQPRESYAG